MDLAIREGSQFKGVLTASPKFAVPVNPSCLWQTYEQCKSEICSTSPDLLGVVRNREGLASPLKLNMEVFAMKTIGHFPFLPSNAIMESCIRGDDELIDVADVFGGYQNFEFQSQPHVVLEDMVF